MLACMHGVACMLSGGCEGNIVAALSRCVCVSLSRSLSHKRSLSLSPSLSSRCRSRAVGRFIDISRQCEYEMVARWTKRLDIFDRDVLFIPV